MLLAVDIGNTHTVLGLFEGDELVHHFRIQSVKDRTEDEYHVLIAGLVRLAGLDAGQVDSSILASVVPPLTERIVSAVNQAFTHDTGVG